MESRPISIEELKPGEFYDIQSSDENPIVLEALLLEQLSNNRTKLMLLNSSDFDHFITPDAQLVLAKRSLQIETVKLGLVYPYHTFTNPPNKILQWPSNYEGQELIAQIKEEMRRAVSEGCWTFDLPHFCEGYLQVYLSYINWRENSPDREVDLWFEFMDSFFSVLRDHILQVKILPREHISGLLNAMKGMDHLSERSWEIRDSPSNSLCIVKEKLADIKNGFFDSYRPIELSSAQFDKLWELIVQEYHHDLVTWQLQEPLSLRNLFLNSNKLIGIISRYRDLGKVLLDVSVPGLDSEIILVVRFRIAVAAQLHHLADDFIEHSGVATEESPRIILEESFLEQVLTIFGEKLEDLVTTRAEMVPSVLAYLKSILRGNVMLSSFLKFVAARIAVEDWQFITFLIRHQSLGCVTIQKQINTEETSDKFKELLVVSLEHQMKAELLRDLLPCESFGHLVFPILTEMFSRPKCREVMITYFRSEEWHTESDKSRAKKRLLCYFRCLTARITLKDWKFITFVIQNSSDIVPATIHSLLDDQEIHDQVKELIETSVKRQMKAELLRDLLPCDDYGNLVFVILAGKSSIPDYRHMITSYFSLQKSTDDLNRSQVKGILSFVQYVTARIALEDWTFVTFVVHDQMLSPKKWYSLLDKQEMYENVTELVSVALEHKMTLNLLRDLLPCKHYGHLVFPILVEMFSRPHCREAMITYFRPETWHTDINNPRAKDRILNFLKSLTARIALEDLEFLTFVAQNESLRPVVEQSILDNQEIYENAKELVGVALEHRTSAELLRNLLPCEDYGHLVFLALIEFFSRPNCREVAIDYFRDEQWHSELYSPQTKDTLVRLLKISTARIALEDMELETFIIENHILRSTKGYSFLESQEVYEQVKELMSVALKHKMGAELLRNLLPCADYGHLVFQAMAEMLSPPDCKAAMIEYFKPEHWRSTMCKSQAKDKALRFFKMLTAQIILEAWEFLSVLADNGAARQYYLLSDNEMYESLKAFLHVALKQEMNGEELRSLHNSHLAFPSLIEGFSLLHCSNVIIVHFRRKDRECFKPEVNKNEKILNFCKILSSRILLKDWEFVTFVAENDSLRPACFEDNQELFENVADLVGVALGEKRSSELLPDLIPCEFYGHLVFPILAEVFSRPHCRDVMITYFRLGHWHTDIDNPRAGDLTLNFLKSLTARIALEDWEFVTFLSENNSLRPAIKLSDRFDDRTYEHVKALVNTALEHNMSVKLVKDLLPCNDYGYFVFPALIELFSHPNCRDAMIVYLRQGKSNSYIYDPQTKDIFLTLLTILTARIALEDWEFVTVMIPKNILRMPIRYHYQRSPVVVYENMRELVSVALEHNMSEELLNDLLPYRDYRYLVFATLVKGFLRSRRFRIMFSYFGSERQCINLAREMLMPNFMTDFDLSRSRVESQERLLRRDGLSPLLLSFVTSFSSSSTYIRVILSIGNPRDSYSIGCL